MFIFASKWHALSHTTAFYIIIIWHNSCLFIQYFKWFVFGKMADQYFMSGVGVLPSRDLRLVARSIDHATVIH